MADKEPPGMMPPTDPSLEAVRADFAHYETLREHLDVRSHMCDQLHENIRYLLELLGDRWIDCNDHMPDTKEPVVYIRPGRSTRWNVGIAYWTVSERWNPERETTSHPYGFTHWMPLPPEPRR